MAFIARLTRSSLLDVYHEDIFVLLVRKRLGGLDYFDASCTSTERFPVIAYLGPLTASLFNR